MKYRTDGKSLDTGFETCWEEGDEIDKSIMSSS